MTEAFNLPVFCNINPRSVYNKVDELQDFIKEEEVDVIFISESWEREDMKLKNIIKIENFDVISNVFQRNGSGGRPALIVNKNKYDVTNLTNNIIQIPWGVEAVWCLLSLKNISKTSRIKKIACCSVYLRPGSRMNTALLDHITDGYNVLKKKYPDGLHFIICGDTNRLNIDPVLNLGPFQQIVTKPTRMDPPAILDTVLTTLASFYQEPVCLPPLDADHDKAGCASDHKIVLVKPIDKFSTESAVNSRLVKMRPITGSGVQKLKDWFIDQNWTEVYQEESAHKKASVFQTLLLDALNKFLPEKMNKFRSDDQVWMTPALKLLDRRRKRIYRKERRSNRWKELHNLFKKEVKVAKSNFYKKTIDDLKNKSPKQWYSALKRISAYDKKMDQVNVEDINHLSDQNQAEVIADSFCAIPNSYEPLKSGDVLVPPFDDSDIPQFKPSEVWLLLAKIKTNKSTVPGDLPAKVIKQFAAYIAEPLTDIINTAIKRGEYPNLYKVEVCTPVPKVNPPQNTSQLRNISGLLTFDKIMEKLISQLIISDMSKKMDNSQYGNQKGVSIQHYLIALLHRILTALDRNVRNETVAVIVNLIDWNNAFPRQCPKLGIESFLKNGVRPSLIPLLINYFQDREMSVKWHGCRSHSRKLNGGGPQGATLGLLEYLSQSNDNADCVCEEDRFKFLDDLSTLEIVNLLTVGIATFDIKEQIPNDLPISNLYISGEKLQSQKWLDEINKWTIKNKMQINEKKTKSMIFNFTSNYQFSTRLKLNNQLIETINDTSLLGTVIQDNLSWDLNTKELVRRANMRMELLRRVAAFCPDIEDLKVIYIQFVRNVLEHSAVVWHSAITEQNSTDLERVQKNAFRIILGERYRSYENALNILNLDTLKVRREKLCLRFALKTSKHPKMNKMFPKEEKEHKMTTRNPEKFKVYHAKTERMKRSPIIFMQKMLNANEKNKEAI